MRSSIGLLPRLLGRFGKTHRPLPALGAGLRLYAVGDIHGRADLLEQLHRLILEDAVSTPSGCVKRVVYLGDYVDRGLNSKEVIDHLLGEPLAGFERIRLKGNHEDAFLRFLEDYRTGPEWFAIGGNATVMSYGVRLTEGLSNTDRFKHVWTELHRLVPEPHIEFLTRLEMSHQVGDYLLVHAGVRPGIPLEEQDPDDLIWIRDEFLHSDADHGKVVVHGHSPRLKPEVRDNRIGVDTTAFATNVLTCLVLDGTTRRFLRTA